MRNDSPSAASLPHVENMSGDMQDTHNSIFFAAVTTTRMPMIVSDPNQPDNPIVFANPAFMKMTGYERHELVGHNCRLLQGPETDLDMVAQVRDAIANHQEIAVELLNYKKDGSSFWNALFISPVFDLNNKLIYFFASQLDVTRRRDVEDRLRQSQKMEAVGQLTGGIAHDFNNLLTVTQGFAEMLQAGLESDRFDPNKAKRQVEAILQATEKGVKLTSQLLAFSRKQKLEGRIVSLKDLSYQIVPLIERSVGDGIEIDVSHHGPLCNARIDPVQAELAIINVSLNAKDAMNGQGRLTIVTSSIHIQSNDTIFGSIEHGHYVSLAISDTGTGMDQETLAHITEPFFTTKSEGKGTGLGMSMVYGFVKQSGGVLKIESELGKGTTVHMLFKCETGDVDKSDVKARKALMGRQGDKETILVVEDKENVAEYAQAVLTEFGYTVLLADNADTALDMLKDNPEIDLLFSDITMPGSMNGVQLARQILKQRIDVKILLTTGYTDNSIDITDEAGNPFSLIRKPYKRVDLIHKLRSVIDGPDGIS